MFGGERFVFVFGDEMGRKNEVIRASDDGDGFGGIPRRVLLPRDRYVLSHGPRDGNELFVSVRGLDQFPDR